MATIYPGNPLNGTYTFTSGGFITPAFTGVDMAAPEPAEKKDHSDGCVCKKCQELFPYAEPNQEDGTLICYACRHGL